jgi:two-component system phosphate regulon sensor histidine kinase PhoR
MVLTIGAIVVFQISWLRKNYEDQKKVLTLRTNFLFRETIFKLQASKLNLDTSIDIRIPDKSGVLNMVNIVKDKLIKDSSGKEHRSKAVIVTFSHDRAEGLPDPPGDSLSGNIKYRLSTFLSGVDSLQEPITTKEISGKYVAALEREGLHVPFVIMASPPGGSKDFLSQDTTGSSVMVGFSKPVEYRLQLGSTFGYLAKKVGPQALFSLVLVGFTIFSFLLLYRNWQQQRRLTELKNDFISNITHELKTPIATVSVAVEALQNFNALQDPARTKEYLDISASELQRLSLLVDKVLRLSLFERQEIELKNEPFDLGVLVEEILASMRLQFEKYKANIVFSPLGENYRLRADKLHITSVIFNLLDNALKYSSHNPSIRVELGSEEDQLVLAVTDNGLGIPLIYRERIFEKFFRVPTGDRHDVKGYGLGLSYVSYVVGRQGGTISVDSQEGIGSRFTVKIPRNDV